MANTEPTGSTAAGHEPARDAGPDINITDADQPARQRARRATKAAKKASAAASTASAQASGSEPIPGEGASGAGSPPAEEAPAPPARSRRRAKAAPAVQEELPISGEPHRTPTGAGQAPVAEAHAAEPATAKRTRRRAAAAKAETPAGGTAAPALETGAAAAPPAATGSARAASGRAPKTGTAAARTEPSPQAEPAREHPAPRAVPTAAVVFMAPPADTDETVQPPPRETSRRAGKAARAAVGAAAGPAAEPETEEEGAPRRGRRTRRTAEVSAEPEQVAAEEPVIEEGAEADTELDAAGRRRRRRGRRGRGRGKGPLEADEIEEAAEAAEAPEEEEEARGEEEPVTRRRRRRRRGAAGAGEAEPSVDEGVVTVVRVRQPRAARDEVQGVTGSTRLEAKRQRRRDGREQRRTRPPILSESEFLARREAVDRVMVVRQRGDRTQVAVLEDHILVEHYVTRQSASTMVGNVYLGKVQNVLPSMEAAFVDIGRGRNAVLYAGEVNWDATGLEGRARSIEQALKSGESVLVQVTKDPIGHKGARLTSHIALSGRHLVYVPNGHASGISRKLSDVERRRLRDILKNLVPDGAGVIVRTAAEGATEEDLARDVKRLQAQWEDIQAKAAAGNAPAVLHAEPDLVIRVVRDLFNEDFREVVIQGSEAYEQVEQYLSQVSPDLVTRVHRHTGAGDAFAEWRIDEQILKALDRKVYLPSGGHLVIDRTEAMTVVDVNTGKYTGAGGNLEETVTRNNLEAAEEIVRQLRLRDLGGIVVIDFIDMVLESNRELVLRRLTECLGRDRTKHQVTEITSLGLVQMTRKRIGQGLLEAFSETCDHCKGRGVIIQAEPVSEKARGNVAEKVRAMAASVRSAAPEESAAEVEAETPEEGVELPAGDEAPLALPEPDLVGDLAAEYSSAEYPDVDFAEDEEETGASVRRRARRSSSRRRTRP